MGYSKTLLIHLPEVKQEKTTLKCFQDKEYAFKLHKLYLIQILRDLYPLEFNKEDFDNSLILQMQIVINILTTGVDVTYH